MNFTILQLLHKKVDNWCVWNVYGSVWYIYFHDKCNIILNSFHRGKFVFNKYKHWLCLTRGGRLYVAIWDPGAAAAAAVQGRLNDRGSCFVLPLSNGYKHPWSPHYVSVLSTQEKYRVWSDARSRSPLTRSDRKYFTVASRILVS